MTKITRGTRRLRKAFHFYRPAAVVRRRVEICRRPTCELLEQRTLLAADLAGWIDPPTDDSAATFAADGMVSSSAIHASEAGSTFATAYDAGELTGSLSLNGSVGGWGDPSDVVKFTLPSQSVVTLGLSGLRSDIDLSLYNRSGQRIGISNKSGSASESISQSLDAGVFYIVVTPRPRAASNYVLSLNAKVIATPPTTTPPTTTPPTSEPSTPTSPVSAFPDVAYYGSSNDWNLNSVNAPEVWAQGYTGAGTIVAVVDTGLDINNPELSSQLWVNADEVPGNRVDDDHNGYVDDVNGWDFASHDNNPTDENGHGTHVAGVISANADGTGSTGVAPNATIMPVRVLDRNGSGTVNAVAAGIRYAAEQGADIINLSLGGSFSTVIQAAVQYAQQLNVLVVVAAGNEYASRPSYPANLSASLNNVISVGAYSSSNSLASFSNDVGSSGAVQVDAPGVNVYSTYLNQRYVTLSGTSMAAPHVAGLAALALSANQSLTAAELRTVIVNGANREISGSDARGGINAALTVALAAAGQASAASASTTVQVGAAASVASWFHSSWMSINTAAVVPPEMPIGAPIAEIAFVSLSSATASTSLDKSAHSEAAQDQALLALFDLPVSRTGNTSGGATVTDTFDIANPSCADEDVLDLVFQTLGTEGLDQPI